MANASILPLTLKSVDYHVQQHHLIKQMDITFDHKALTLILGANGAGKTLLLKLCCGLIKNTGGSLQWAEDVSRKKGKPLPFSLVFHKPVLLQRSVMDNICFALQDLPKLSAISRAEAALKWAGIETLAEKNATLLSTGQQQLVAIARAWATAPQVLFLDEPTANLDPDATERMESLIAALHQQGTKIIMSTHNLGQARRLADEIIFVDRGRISEQRDAKQFFAKPQSHVAQRFLATEGFL